jgi:hypothetical protein
MAFATDGQPTSAVPAAATKNLGAAFSANAAGASSRDLALKGALAPRGGCAAINAGGCTPVDNDLQVGISGGSINQSCGSNEWVALAFPIDTGSGATIQAINMTHNTNTGNGDLYLTGDAGGCPDVNNILWTGDCVISGNGTGLPTTYCTGPVAASGTVWVVATFHSPNFDFDVAYDDDGSGGTNFGLAYGNLVSDGSCGNWQDLALFAFGYCYHVNVDLADECGDCTDVIFNGCSAGCGGEGEGEGEGECGDGGDCCTPGSGPFCSDIDCCEAICAIDPFCCDNTWDSICADEADAEEVLCDEGTCVPPPPPTCLAWGCDGDANGDGVVDPLDTGYILSRFGLDPCVEGCDADVNCDGVIDPLDSGYSLSRFGICDPPPECVISCPGVTADHCEDAVIQSLSSGGSIVINGNNVGADMQCVAGGYEEVWAAISTTETLDITLSLCGTNPPFANAYIVIDDSCPCDGAWLFATSWTNTCDGNWVVTYTGVPAGTWYLPLLSGFIGGDCDGDFVWTISAL